mmetsp:Transcript_5299/g.11896  ORF Transcript_5299/g.11896 Transcript_5299/m.11896 type:complete len:82 (+) Transcript_5299:519-764(+)
MKNSGEHSTTWLLSPSSYSFVTCAGGQCHRYSVCTCRPFVFSSSFFWLFLVEGSGQPLLAVDASSFSSGGQCSGDVEVLLV